MPTQVQIPQGETIQLNQDGSLQVPDNPIIPFIEGDGIGVDVTPAMKAVLMLQSKKPIKASVKLLGWKFTQVKKQTSFMVKILGCRMKP